MKVWLAAVALVALDAVTSPRHGVLDALAVMMLVGVLARRWSLLRWRSVISQVLVSALVFTAGAYWFTVAKALVFVGGVPLDASIMNFEQWFTGQPPT